MIYIFVNLGHQNLEESMNIANERPVPRLTTAKYVFFFFVYTRDDTKKAPFKH